MSNRWNQSLHRKINEKRENLKQKQHREEINHKIVQQVEELNRIQEQLEETPLLDSDEEFERFERRIESVEVEE